MVANGGLDSVARPDYGTLGAASTGQTYRTGGKKRVRVAQNAAHYLFSW